MSSTAITTARYTAYRYCSKRYFFNNNHHQLFSSSISSLLLPSSATVGDNKKRLPSYSLRLNNQYRNFGTGSRGSRGHGWYLNYRSGKGGRHLQGELSERKSEHQELVHWNNQMMDFRLDGDESTNKWVFLDVELRSASSSRTVAAKTTVNKNENSDNDDEKKEEDDEKKEEEDVADDVDEKMNHNKQNKIERIKIELNPRILPHVCNNFINLCQNVYPLSDIATPTKNNYKGNDDEEEEEHANRGASVGGTRFYRMIREVGICAGDILTNTGKTGQSYSKFIKYGPNANINNEYSDVDLTKSDNADEEVDDSIDNIEDDSSIDDNGNSLIVEHPLFDEKSNNEEPLAFYSLAGYVSMICPKVNRYDSRFLLLTNDSHHLDGNQIVFGRLCPSSLEKVQFWCNELLLTNYGGKPKNYDLVIVNGGLLEKEEANENNADDKKGEVDKDSKGKKI